MEMETQDSLDIRALKRLILGPIPEPSQAAEPTNVPETRDVQTACDGVAAGFKLDDRIDHQHINGASDRRHDHHNSQARAQSLQILCPLTAATEDLRAQSQPLPKKMSTQGSEEKTQEIGEEELAELAKNLQEEHAQRSSRIDGDETGNIDLLKSFEQSHVDRYDEDEDNEDDFGGESQVRAEMFPESKRFKLPATPAMNGKKQIHAAEVVTPSLPANPFAQHGAGSTGIIPMSQAFKYTQPSSPHRKVIPSDPASELPSPAVFNAFRSPVLPASSSPTALAIVAKNNAFIERRPTDVAMEGSEGQKGRRARRSSMTNGKAEEDSSDDAFDRSTVELMIKRKQAIQKIEEETRKQFEMVTAPSREAANARGKRQKRGKARDKGVENKSQKISPIPDDISNTDAGVDGDTTEDESESNTRARTKNANAMDITRDFQAHMAKSHAELDRQQVVDHGSLSTYRRRQLPQRVHQEDKRTSISPSEQSPPTKDHADVDQPLGANLSTVAQVVEVENSQPSISQVKSRETQYSGFSALPSLPSSLGSGFLVSRSQYDDLPLPSHGNQSFTDMYSEQSSYLPQPPSSSSVRGDSSPLVSQSRSQGLSSVHGESDDYSQKKTADDAHYDLENRQAIIERSSPPLFAVSKATEHNDSVPNTLVIGNSGPTEDLEFPQQTINRGHLENSGICEIDTPLNAKPLFSASETTIPETSPAVGCVSRLPLHEHLNRTPQPSPIPPPKDVTVSREYTSQSSGSNIFETARSQLSSRPTCLMDRNCQNTISSRQATSPRSSEVGNRKVLVIDPSPSNSLSEDINLIMGNGEKIEDKVSLRETPLTPANKRRKGVSGCVIPETEAKVRPSRATDKADEPWGNGGEQNSSIAGQIKTPDGAATTDKGKRRLSNPVGKVKLLSKEAGKLDDLNSDPGAMGPEVGEPSSNSLIPKTAVPVTKVSRSIPPRSLRADVVSFQNALVTESNPEPGANEPNRVLALFKNGNMSYYPATCRFVVGVDNPRFKVRFDDGTEDLLEPQNVRRFDLRLGDVVKVDLHNLRTKNYVVCGFKDCKAKSAPFTSPLRNRGDPQDYPATDIRGYSTILLQQKQRDSFPNEESNFNGEEITVPISSVYIVKSMWHKFDDRVYTHISDFSRPSSRDQTPRGLYSNPTTPTRARRMTPSVLAQTANPDPQGAMSRLTKGIFKGMVFAVTYLNEEAEKEEIVKEIVDNGGKVLHGGFEELFLADWFTAASGDRHSFRLKRDAEKFGFACVVANNYSRKPKFMGALALGLPCLHGRWIKDCAKKNEVVDWDPYLLPSGESSYLGGTARSRVLQFYPPLTARLLDTIASRPKPLEGQSVILVMGKGKAEDRRKVFLFLIFALGASKVSKVSNLEAAKRFLTYAENNTESWDWICVDDGHVKDAKKALSGRGAVPRKKRKRSAIEDGDAEAEVGFSKVKVMSDEHVMQTVVMSKLMAEE